jgi:UPF0271 protein
VKPLGDDAVRLDLPAGVDRAAALRGLLAWPRVCDAVLADETAAVWFTPGEPPDLASWSWPLGAPSGSLHRLAVAWDGPDLADLGGDPWVEAIRALALEVRFLGFFPGFAYLGDVPEALRAPRRATPRARMPAGAVATAGPYFGIYPGGTPGGWNWVGTLAGSLPAFAPGDVVRWL